MSTAAVTPTAEPKHPSKTKAAAPAKSTARKSTARKTTAQKAVAKKAITPLKTSHKPAVTATPKAPEVAAPEKAKTAKKPKLVRDSFTMPKDEYLAIETLKQRATRLQRTTKKSELLRAGIMALSAMDDKGFAAILAKVPALKTGRPLRG
jgi:hypothetical protein